MKWASTTQAALVVQRVRAVLDGCRFVTVADLTKLAPAKVPRSLSGRVVLPRIEGGLSAQSADYFRKAIGRFGWSLSARKNAPVRADLFAEVPGFDGKREQVHKWRALSPSEMATLIDATRAGEEVYGLTGEERYFLYLVAFSTGLRASELASLLPTAFQLNADNPTVVIAAKRSKKWTSATIPLACGLAGQLRTFLANKPAGAPIWYGSGTCARDGKGAEILRRDLAVVGIPYRLDTLDGPRFADFHAIRHSYVTALAAAGVNPKDLQTLARHADPAMTLGLYSHTTPEALAAAVGKLALPNNEENANPLAALTRVDLERCVVGLLGVVSSLLHHQTSALRDRVAGDASEG